MQSNIVVSLGSVVEPPPRDIKRQGPQTSPYASACQELSRPSQHQQQREWTGANKYRTKLHILPLTVLPSTKTVRGRRLEVTTGVRMPLCSYHPPPPPKPWARAMLARSVRQPVSGHPTAGVLDRG